MFYVCSMGSGQNTSAGTAFGWARRVLCQQLDALARLTAIAWRLIEPAPPAADTAPTLWARLSNLEKTLRLRERVFWAQRLIEALQAKLTAELEALDNGQAIASTAETVGVEAEPNSKPEAERPEPRECLKDRERFGFERRGSDKALAEILKRPTAEIIALICRELGLPADWPRLAEEAWAREEADDEGTAPPDPTPSDGSPLSVSRGPSRIVPAPS